MFMKPLLRSLPVLFALLTPAFAQAGPEIAASAKTQAQALAQYVDGVSKAGGRPDFAAPPAADLLHNIFDLNALESLPTAQSGDVMWLLDWGDAANRSYKQIMLFGVRTSPAIDEVALKRNMIEYEDQCVSAMNFLIRFEAREVAAMLLFMDQLTPDQRTPVREAGLKRARSGAEELIRGALISVAQGMKPGNARTLTAAIRDTRDTWSGFIAPENRTQIIALVRILQKNITDAEIQNNLATFSEKFAAN
jgi:hypothetical protein